MVSDRLLYFYSSARRNPLLIVSLLSLFIVLSRYILNGDPMAGNLDASRLMLGIDAHEVDSVPRRLFAML